jgi:hypothetical protein
VTFKRLYYDVALHGGGLGFHDLGQGSSYEHQLIFQPVFLYVFAPALTGVEWSVGTALQPALLFALQDLTVFSPGDLQRINAQTFESLFTSHWGVTFTTAVETGGVIEFIFDSHRRQ